MNRKAKRNKYKKLQRELEKEIQSYKTWQMADAFDRANSKASKIRQLSCFREMLDLEQVVAPELRKDNYKKDVVRQLAEEILKHNELMKITDCGYGYRYDILVVEQ
jgi:hypothetical protein